MSECTNKTLGQKLHAYELGLLSEQEALEVELHILECPECMDSAARFIDTVRLLRHHPQVGELSRRQASSGGLHIVRFLAIAALLLVVATPVYYLWYKQNPDASHVQRLYLTPIRANDARTVFLDSSGSVEIDFLIADSLHQGAYEIRIDARKGHTVFVDSVFTSYDSSGSGHISLPTKVFDRGFYALKVIRQDSTLTVYYFRVD